MSNSLPEKHKEVYIPFLEQFKEPMLKDIKICTTRSKVYGQKGDYFWKWGAMFRIDEVRVLNLATVARSFWKEEGCSSDEDFRRVWRSIHPKVGFDEERDYHTHFFHRVRSGNL